MIDSGYVEWTIWNTARNYPLISVGDREANEIRLRELESGQPEAFHLVCREVGPWKKPPRSKCTDRCDYKPIPHLPGDGQGGLECTRCGSSVFPGPRRQR